MFPRVGEKRRIEEIGLEDEEAIGSLCRLSDRPVSPKSAMEQEKRIRREIANSNERRRMQSINAGFASLKTLLPHNEGEKLSKAAILQQTAEYIYQLEQDKTRLLSQNCHLKRLLHQHQQQIENDGSPAGGDSPVNERCTNSPMTITADCTEVDMQPVEDNKHEILELRLQLEKERRHRMNMEEHLAKQDYPVQEVKLEYEDHEIEKDSEEKPRITRVNKVITIAKSEAHFRPQQKNGTYIPQVSSSACKITKANVTTPTTVTVGRTIQHQVQQAPTTIVTVVPSKENNNPIPSVLEALSSNKKCGQGSVKVEVEPALRVPSPATTIECVDESGSTLNRTVYIVNSGNANCQKSLDTICEAIRHLEGDHMFPVDEQHPPIEEEIITDDTFVTVEDHSFHHQGNAHSSAHGQVTLHMVPSESMVPEPQEVPLELTTHRVTHSAESVVSSNSSSITSSNLLQVTRPGVIVVKQT